MRRLAGVCFAKLGEGGRTAFGPTPKRGATGTPWRGTEAQESIGAHVGVTAAAARLRTRTGEQGPGAERPPNATTDP